MKCVERKMIKSTVAPNSYRRRNVSGGFLLFACPRRNWKGGRCRGGMKLVEKVRTNTTHCRRGEHAKRG